MSTPQSRDRAAAAGLDPGQDDGETGPSNRAILDFNFAPIASLDPSWLKSLPHGALIAQLAPIAASRSWLSAHLLQSSALSDQVWNDFSAARTRLALMDRDDLQRLLLLVGVALRHKEIRMEIDGSRIQRLRASIGKAAHEFALRSAPLFAPSTSFSCDDALDEPRDRFVLVGACYALDVHAARDPAYLTRLAWRLPEPVFDKLGQFVDQHATENAEQALPPLVRRLMKETAPQWLPMFA